MTARRLTFRAWLRSYREVDSKIGDVARDVRYDRDFPQEPLSWNRIEGYLSAVCASPGALAATEEAWRLYRAEVRET